MKSSNECPLNNLKLKAVTSSAHHLMRFRDRFSDSSFSSSDSDPELS